MQAQYAEEIRRVLCSRLRLYGLVVAIGMPLLLLAELLDPDQSDKLTLREYLPYLTALSLFLVPLAVLLGKRNLSLDRLRGIEIGYFIASALVLSWGQYRWYFESWLPAKANRGADAFAYSILCDSMSFPWFTLIVFYGTCIPATARRCAWMVGPLALASLGVTVLLGMQEAERGRFLLGVVLPKQFVWMAIAVAIAVFGSYKLSTLHREAFKARRLGHYTLKQLLGKGGMGEVYLGEHQLLARPCAIKLIRADKAGDATTLLRFQREVQVTATLTHPCAIEIYDYGHAEDGTFYYVMEYLKGKNLEEIVRETGTMPPERVVHLLRQVCGALREAHDAGLVHRDVKPNNIIVCQRGGIADVAKIADFGLVHERHGGPSSAKLTLAGTVLGSPLFMSPEQVAGSVDLDGRSDLYSLGLVAYYLLTALNPFRRATAREVFNAHLNDTPLSLARACPSADVDLCSVVMRCLEKDPNARYPDAASLDQALAHCSCAGRWSPEIASAWWHGHVTPPEVHATPAPP